MEKYEYNLDKTVPKHLLKRPKISNLIRFSLEDWFIILLCAAAAIKLSAWFYPVLAIIMAGRFHSLGVILHDLSHQNIKKKSAGMFLVEFLAGYPVFVTTRQMAYHHNRHHRYTNTEKDPYFKPSNQHGSHRVFITSFIKGFLLEAVWFLRPFISPLALMMPNLRNTYAKAFLLDVTGADMTQNKEVIQCIKDDIPALLFNIGMITWAIINPIMIYLYFIPVFIGGVFSIYRLLTEHIYEEMASTSKESMLSCTFDHHMSLFDKLFFAPRNIGFHIAHHLYPTVALEQLPKIREYYTKETA